MNRRLLLAAATTSLTLFLVPTPGVGAATTNAHPHSSPQPGWFQSDTALWIGLGILFVGLALGLALVLAPRLARSQLSGTSIKIAGASSRISSLGDQATRFAERSLARNERGSRLNVALERAGIAMRPSEFAVIAATATFVVFIVALLLTNFLVALVAAAVVPLLGRIGVTALAQRRSEKFADQLEQTLPLMGGSLRAGFGIMQALDAVAMESESPTSDEFHRLIVETRLGRDLTDAMAALADRVASEDFNWVVQAIEIHRQVGGDLAQVLDNVYATIRDRNRIRRQIKALSAEGRFSALVLFILPLAMFGVITVLNPNYISELTTHTIGIVMLIGAGALMTMGGFWLRRIVRLVF